MGRLIDADELKNNYTNTFVNVFGVKGAEMFQGVIDQTKTAFDVEKVVAELEKESVGAFAIQTISFRRAVDILKRGGVND